MIELISLGLSCWLFIVVGKLLFKVAWGATKITACIFFTLALPTLIGGLLLASGLVLIVPVGLLILAVLLLKEGV